MKQKINHSLVEKLPRNHFGDVTEKVLKDLKSGRCHSVYGLPGYGMEFFAKSILNLVQTELPDFSSLLINVEHNKDSLKIFKENNVEKFIENNKLVLVLAEVLTPKYADFFSYINHLKWLSKDNLSVLVVADYSMYSEHTSYLQVGPDIFHPLSIIKPFDYEKTVKIIELNNTEYNWNIPLKHARKIYNLSGGIPALTKYICMAMYEEGFELIENPAKLVSIQPLTKRLQDLSALITRVDVEKLKKLGLLDERNKLVSGLVRYYLDQEELNGLSIAFDDLSRNEKKLLKCFIDNVGNTINKDQIAIVLGQDLDTYSEWAIYKAVERLKAKVSDILTIESSYGTGWVLRHKPQQPAS
jgi:hypothetical protein